MNSAKIKWLVSLVTSLIFFANSTMYAQDRDDKHATLEHIHSIKVAYITDRLNLTSQQSQVFWPVYSSYEKELKALRKSYFEKYKGVDKNDDHVSRQFFDDNLDFQAASVDLKRKYRDQFLNVLTPQQLANLFKAEHDFNIMLMQRLKDKHNGNDGVMWKVHDGR
ncbi:MAG: Spy/CpxP family protein refolding chaperone [Flavipsychrobacter sp.]|nr:Spy/CpxP family protein refolding chaperone [Flavipsychrobacter sp.]